MATFRSSGTVTMGGTTDVYTVTHMDTGDGGGVDVVHRQWSIGWRRNAFIRRDFMFSWQRGNLPLYWYRIQGKPRSGADCPPVQSQDCCKQIVVNIAARSLRDLCQKISARKFTFPIDRVDRFSRPAENSVLAAQEAAGIDHSCNVLEQVDICTIPQCADMCIDYDVTVRAAASATARIISEFQYLSSGSAYVYGSTPLTVRKNIPTEYVTSSGSITVEGSNEITYLKVFLTSGGEISIDGTTPVSAHQAGSGGAVLGGSAVVTPYLEESSGGLVAGGEALAIPYHETASGGVRLGGAAPEEHFLTTSGGVRIGGTSFTPEEIVRVASEGAVEMGGESPIKSSFWRIVSGGTVEMGGTTGQRFSQLGTFSAQGAARVSVSDFQGVFSDGLEIGGALGASRTVTRCDCILLPLTIELSHDIARDNVLASFLTRNRYTISRRMKLKHSETNDSWQANLHYRGRAPNSTDFERWNILFELQCSAAQAGIELGRTVWRTGIYVSRYLESTQERYDSKILVSVLPDPFCGGINGQLNFDVVYDVVNDVVGVDPAAAVYHQMVYDRVGLFKNRSWIESPNLNLRVSQTTGAVPVVRVDLTDSVLS